MKEAFHGDPTVGSRL